MEVDAAAVVAAENAVVEDVAAAKDCPDSLHQVTWMTTIHEGKHRE